MKKSEYLPPPPPPPRHILDSLAIKTLLYAHRKYARVPCWEKLRFFWMQTSNEQISLHISSLIILHLCSSLFGQYISYTYNKCLLSIICSLYRLFFFRKNGISLFCTKVGLLFICRWVHPSVTFLVNVSPRSNFKLCTWIGHIMQRVVGNILCDLDPKVK